MAFKKKDIKETSDWVQLYLGKKKMILCSSKKHQAGLSQSQELGETSFSSAEKLF